MVDDDVPQRTNRIVKVPSVLDSEALGQRDLYAVDEIPVPDRLEHAVAEPEMQNLLEPHFPEVMINAKDLGFVDVSVQLICKFVRRCQVVTEGLLNDNARRFCDAGLRQILHHGTKQEWRDLQIEDWPGVSLDRVGDTLVGRRVREVSGDVREPG